MGSVGNQSPWPPYKDCSQGICSISCPQWCYITFPPPYPPPFTAGNDSSATDISPLLIIAIIGILASALILVSYYTLISKSCRRRNQTDNTLELNENHNQARSEERQGATNGLDESIIKSIAMYKYKKGEGLIDGTDCSVCLSEFQENEGLRLLPKCNHAFHLPCIDPWLKSHASCPLCRANVVHTNVDLLPQAPTTSPTTSQGAPRSIYVSTLDQYQHRMNNESVVVIQVLEEGISNLVFEDAIPKNPSDQDPEYGRSDQPTRSSASSNCSGAIFTTPPE